MALPEFQIEGVFAVFLRFDHAALVVNVQCSPNLESKCKAISFVPAPLVVKFRIRSATKQLCISFPLGLPVSMGPEIVCT